VRYLLATAAFSNPKLLEKCIRSWPKLDFLVDRLVYFDGYKWEEVFKDVIEREVFNEIGVGGFGDSDHYGCSGSWNRLLQVAFEDNEDIDALVVVGSDTEFRDDFLVGFINEIESQGLDFAVTREYSWNCWCITKKCYEVVGDFDLSYIPCYWEDNDYHYRVLLSGIKWDYVGDQTKFEHYGSATIRIDENYGSANNNNFFMNGDYFVSKWGGTPGDEKYIFPYNNPELSIKDWVLDEEKYNYKKKIWNKN